MKKLLFLTGLLALSASCFAEVVQCTGRTVDSVTVENVRDDGLSFEETVVVKLTEQCNGVYYGVVSVNYVASLHFMQLALAAKTTGSTVDIALNTSSEYVNNNLESEPTVGYQMAYISVN